MADQTYSVTWMIEGSVEVTLPEDASDAQISEAARRAVTDDARKARGGLPGDLMILDIEIAD